VAFSLLDYDFVVVWNGFVAVNYHFVTVGNRFGSNQKLTFLKKVSFYRLKPCFCGKFTTHLANSQKLIA